MHSFDPMVAERVGVNAAVIYQNFLFWCEKNKANKRHIRDGYVWTYNSTRALSELFPYLTQSQIKTALSKLVDEGLIVKGEYNLASYDRTSWYSPKVTSEWLSPIGQKSPMEQTEIANGLAENRQPIPDGKPDNKPDEIYIYHFEDFWSAYPRKIGKGNARKAFASAMKKASIEEISSGLNAQLEILSAKEQKYIPHASTWLNGERWNDEPTHNQDRDSRADTTTRAIAFAARARRTPSGDSF